MTIGVGSAMPGSTPTIGVVCVTYNSGRHLDEMLSSVASGFRTIVVDNGSADDSVDLARLAGARVVSLPRNVGFASAANIGVALLDTDLIAFLNPDVFVSRSELILLGHDLWSRPDVGLVAPSLHFPDGRPQLSARGFPTLMRLLSRLVSRFGVGTVDPTSRPDWVIGAVMLVRRVEFLDLRGFDASFFLYGEDVDLCWRYRGVGLSVRVHSDVSVAHVYGRASKSKLALGRPAVRRHWTSIGRLAWKYPSDFFRFPLTRPLRRATVDG